MLPTWLLQLCTVTLTNHWNVRKIRPHNGRSKWRSRLLCVRWPSRLSPFVIFIAENGPPKVCLLASSEIALCAQIGSFRLSCAAYKAFEAGKCTSALEGGALRLIQRTFCNDACYIYYVWNAEPVWQSGRRPPQQKFVVWVCKFPGKFVYRNVYRNDITHGCGYTHKLSNAQTFTVEKLKSKS